VQLRLGERPEDGRIEGRGVHRRMIGAGRPAGRWPSRGTAAGVLAILLIGGSLAARPAVAASADPPTEAERQAWLLATAARADAALEQQLLRLTEAVDSARRGSALIVSGQDPPSPALERAAGMLEGARDEATAAAAAMTELRGTLACVRPEVAVLPDVGVAVDDLDSIAVQLRAAAAAAGPFVERRLATEATLAALAAALAALDRDDARAALLALGDADAARDEVAAWEEPPPSLAYWVDTTGALLAAARAIADAALAGDSAAVEIAAAAYSAAAERASPADRALALALAEAGSAIAAIPLRRLTDALTELTALRAAVASVISA
jgi:hypothetical protein